MPRPIHLCMPHHGTLYDPRPCVIQAWYAGETSWVEFRGAPYFLWGVRTQGGEAQRIHDALEGWHACVLHAGDTLTLLDWHPDYERVRAFLK